MFNYNVAVIDVGSSKITALVGGRGVNGTFNVKAVKTVLYSGFENGIFYGLEELKDAVTSAVKSIEATCNFKLKQVYVGVPGEFVSVTAEKKFSAYARRKKIRAGDVLKLLSMPPSQIPKASALIKAAPAYFVLGDTTKTVAPVGLLSGSLEGLITYFFCENSFINIFDQIFAQSGIKEVKYLPVSLAQALYLIPPESRDQSVFMADIGYITSTFSEVCGNGIVFQKSFSRGCGHIAAYLSHDLDIDFELAQIIISQSNLSYDLSKNDDYRVLYSDELFSFPAQQVNCIIESGLDEICEYLSVCLIKSGGKSDALKITGGGVFSIRGGKEHLSRRLNLNIDNCTPRLPYFNKPHDSSVISLLDAALSERENKLLF